MVNPESALYSSLTIDVRIPLSPKELLHKILTHEVQGTSCNLAVGLYCLSIHRSKHDTSLHSLTFWSHTVLIIKLTSIVVNKATPVHFERNVSGYRCTLTTGIGDFPPRAIVYLR